MDFKVKFLQIQTKLWKVLLHEEVFLKTPNARAMLSGQSASETIDGGASWEAIKGGDDLEIIHPQYVSIQTHLCPPP